MTRVFDISDGGPLLILGASVRAAAFSALRARIRPRCLDLFADSDLCDVAFANQVAPYPQGLRRAAQRLEMCPWIYTGALENHPRLVEKIASERPLWGNGADVLRQVRNFKLLHAFLNEAGYCCPSIRPMSRPPDDPSGWLVKPIRSCGGARIVWASELDGRRRTPSARLRARAPRRGRYYQQHIAGAPCCAAFVAQGRRSVLWGVSQQLIGAEWSGAAGFRYAGSMGPISLSDSLVQCLTRLGNDLTERFSLCGLFGVDFVLSGEEVWPLEVNPRYTASMEVLEYAGGMPAVALHKGACVHGRLPEQSALAVASRTSARFAGKAVIYARRQFVVSPAFVKQAQADNSDRIWPHVADIPRPGETIAAGRPVVTVFAYGDSLDQVEHRLRSAAARVHDLLASAGKDV